VGRFGGSFLQRPHRDGLEVLGVYAAETIDDREDIVAAAFFAVGNDVDAGAVLILDGLKRRPVQPS